MKVSYTTTSTFTSTTDSLASFYLNFLSSNFYLWTLLGHIPASRLKYLVYTRALGKLQISHVSDCCGCKLAKKIVLPFNKSIFISYKPFDLIHYDVWGPSLVITKGGSKYYVLFIDDCQMISQDLYGVNRSQVKIWSKIGFEKVYSAEASFKNFPDQKSSNRT